MGFLRSMVSRKFVWLTGFYIALLILSFIYRSQIQTPALPATKEVVFLNAIDGNETLSEKIRFAYQDTGETSQQNKIPIIFVHGSPGSSEAFDRLTKLIKDRRIISVDLPGFGDSETNIPDYSIDALAKYLEALMRELKIKKAHFVGFSLGGGVILHLIEDNPNRVESLTFIASIGVQEYELLGNYYANRIVHGAQLAFLWALRELTPHFGTFDGRMMPYARNFYETDQRPLRRMLEKVEKPFLIIHGKDDPLVPVEAAREHARIVPQSEYHELDDNHFFVFMRPEIIDETLNSFWTRVENQKAQTRKTASEKRIAESKAPIKPEIVKAIGPTIIIFVLLLLVLTFINEDAAFLIAGFLAAQGWFGLDFAVIISIFGALLSILVMLLIGKFFGNKKRETSGPQVGFLNILKRKPFRFHFFLYLRTGKTHPAFWKPLFRFFTAAAFWAIVLNGISYLLSSFVY